MASQGWPSGVTWNLTILVMLLFAGCGGSGGDSGEVAEIRRRPPRRRNGLAIAGNTLVAGAPYEDSCGQALTGTKAITVVDLRRIQLLAIITFLPLRSGLARCMCTCCSKNNVPGSLPAIHASQYRTALP